MILTLSIKDINFMKYLFLFLNLFLITPWYDFDRNVSYSVKLQRVYGIILLLAAIARLTYVTIDLHRFIYIARVSVSESFTWYSICVILVLITCTVIFKSCFLDVGKWKLLFTNLRCVDRSLNNVGKVEANFSKSFYFSFFLQQVLFLIGIGFGEYTWSDHMRFPLLQIIIITCACEMYYEFLLVLLINALVRSFKSRYQDLNRRTLMVSRETKIVQRIRSLAQDYRILGETIDLFNEIFGWPLLLMILHFGLEMVNTLYYNFLILVGKGTADLHGHLANFFLWLWMLGSFLTIVLPIHATQKESRKFIGLLYKMQDFFEEGSVEMGALNRLVSYSKNFAPKFSGAGFFSINRAIIFSVLANVGTYVVIMFQVDYSQANSCP
ncbi:hypothetical protein Zmor_019958 [Zophobas morio]|uniref:Gustatory receptor n=1 Tax=Zophobas morio TaxID=2755281 RepID=A0AA38M9W7_9CUCU|nr:hypothetical protein Zmor_019958 [Zophobas morio]